jgi:hypothetical protein
VSALHKLLSEAASGMTYWNPVTARGKIVKSDVLARIERVLFPPEADETIGVII